MYKTAASLTRKFDQSILGKLRRTSETLSQARELIADIKRFKLDKSSLGG